MNKLDMRKKYIKIRNELNNKELKNKKIYEKIIKNKVINSCKTILIYVSYNSEVDTINLIKYFLNYKQVAIPKIDENVMNFYYIDSLNDLSLGKYNILEPTTNRIVKDYNNIVSITPGICFSREGYRIGYGKGFYDKFYQLHNVYSIGLCYKECLIEKIPYDKYDIKVNEIITD